MPEALPPSPDTSSQPPFRLENLGGMRASQRGEEERRFWGFALFLLPSL
jgi:hypothetical protein